MNTVFIETPSGQFLSAGHIVSLDIQPVGQADQRRHEVQATLVHGDRQLLATFRGDRSREDAERYVSQVLEQLGARRFQPPPGAQP